MEFSKNTIENFILGNFPEARYVSGSKDEIQFNTPFDTDKKRRLYVSTETGKWFDQKAQRGSNKFEFFVAEYLEISVGEAVKLLLKEYKDDDYVPPVVEKEDKKEISPLEIPSGVKFFDEGGDLGYVGNMAFSYLESRNISHNGLGYVSSEDPSYNKRIFVPFYENGDLVYFLARSIIPNEELRYRNPSNLSAGDYVFNYDKINNEVFIFEGVFDALSLDFPQVGTAMLSSSLKDNQAKKILMKNPSSIIFVPDNDKSPKVRFTILSNLLKSKNKLMENKKYKQNFTVFIYNIPGGYKDFNAYKMGTGEGTIPITDCKIFNDMEIMMEMASLKV